MNKFIFYFVFLTILVLTISSVKLNKDDCTGYLKEIIPEKDVNDGDARPKRCHPTERNILQEKGNSSYADFRKWWTKQILSKIKNRRESDTTRPQFLNYNIKQSKIKPKLNLNFQEDLNLKKIKKQLPQSLSKENTTEETKELLTLSDTILKNIKNNYPEDNTESSDNFLSYNKTTTEANNSTNDSNLQIQKNVSNEINEQQLLFGDKDKESLKNSIISELKGNANLEFEQEPINKYLKDPQINDIMMNSKEMLPLQQIRQQLSATQPHKITSKMYDNEEVNVTLEDESVSNENNNHQHYKCLPVELKKYCACGCEEDKFLKIPSKHKSKYEIIGNIAAWAAKLHNIRD